MQRLWSLTIISICYLSVLVCMNVDPNEPLCFTVPFKNCTLLKNESKCDKIDDAFTRQIFCCNITNDKEISEFIESQITPSHQISGFHLRDSTLSQLNMNIFDQLKSLTSLSITENNISRIVGILDEHLNLNCLNISLNVISEIHPHLILKQKRLSNIVITNNTNITILPDLPSMQVSFRLDVSGNIQLSCKYLINITQMITQKSIDLIHVNRNSTVCSPPHGKIFIDTAISIGIEQLQKIEEIFSDCPTINENKKCTCSVHSLDVGVNKTFHYQALVNCSNQQMTSLPSKLPSNTRVLDISYNNIRSFDGIGNETYANIRELYADNNKITSLKPLEGTTFLYNFQNLTLRNNKIDQIQAYMLSNVFDRYSGRIVLLAKNELKCDCITASQTKMWLLANKAHIPDFNEVFTTCSNNHMKVIDMNQKDFCLEPTNWKGYIRYLIFAEISLFVLLIGKVSYDYYIFKTLGYLPWPASKMPKLPCDWCFET